MATSYSGMVLDEVTFTGGTAFTCAASDGECQIKTLSLDATADQVLAVFLTAVCTSADAGYDIGARVPIPMNATFNGTAKAYTNSDSFFCKITGSAGSLVVTIFYNNCGGEDEPLEKVLIHGLGAGLNDGKRKNMDITKWDFHLAVLSLDLP